ncbi:MAG: cytochrome c [Acidobacteriota bacterium]|nr:cytochrome c [Acidobacteriota bacterium]
MRTGVAILALLSFACRQDMFDRPPKRPLGYTPMFANANSSRPSVPGTVPRDHGVTDELLENGTIAGVEADVAPFPIDLVLVRRGRERFNIDCSPCHGVLGDGQGMVVLRGFPQPPSFHSARLRAAPVGHFVRVMTNGFGTMYSYGDRVKPRDRWAIAGYIRALQLSQAGSGAVH